MVRPACLEGDRHLQHTLMGISHRVEQPVQTSHQCLKQVKVDMHVLIMMGTQAAIHLHCKSDPQHHQLQGDV